MPCRPMAHLREIVREIGWARDPDNRSSYHRDASVAYRRGLPGMRYATLLKRYVLRPFGSPISLSMWQDQ